MNNMTHFIVGQHHLYIHTCIVKRHTNVTHVVVGQQHVLKCVEISKEHQHVYMHTYMHAYINMNNMTHFLVIYCKKTYKCDSRSCGAAPCP